MTHHLTTLQNKTLTVTVSDIGAETQSLVTHCGQSLLWNGNPDYWTGRSPVLFPVVGRSHGQRVAFGDFEAAMPKHGFALTSRFELEEQTADMCRHVLRDSPDTRAIYPFAFCFAMTHKLQGNDLTVIADITNEGKHPMPFGFGFHPAFVWPLPGGEGQPHKLILDNAGEPALARLQDGFLPDERLASPFVQGQLTPSPEMFDADAMIFPTGAGTGVTWGVDNGPQIHVTFDNLPNLAFWTKPDAPYLCIEPWHGIDAKTGAGTQMADRPFVFTLAPGATTQFSYTTSVLL